MSLLDLTRSFRKNPLSADSPEKAEVARPARTWVTVVTFLFILAASLYRGTKFVESDVFWGARNGWDILTKTGLNLTQPDTWNALTLGESWTPNSWLWNVLLAVFYHRFGDFGFSVLTSGVSLAASVLLWRYLLRVGLVPLMASLVLVGCWLTVMMSYMNGRANTADFLILTAFLYGGSRLRSKPVLFLGFSFLLTVLWVNLHLSGASAAVVFPVVTYALFHGETVKRRLVIAVLTAVAAASAALLTPFGFSVFQKIAEVDSASKGMIVEWSSVFAHPEASLFVFELIPFALAALVILARKRSFLYGLAVAGMLVMTVTTIRFAPFLLIILLGSLACFRYNPEAPAFFGKFRMAELYAKATLLTLTAVIGVMAVLAGARVVSEPQSMFPVPHDAYAAIPHGSVVAGSQNAQSEMILYRPDVLVTLDGRNDLMGRDRFYSTTFVLNNEDGSLPAWLAAHHVNAVILNPDEPGLSPAAVEGNLKKLGWSEQKAGKAMLFFPPAR